MPDSTWIAGGNLEHAGPGRFDRALEWIKKNRETFIGSVVILLAAGVFAVYFFMHYRDTRDSAWKALFIAQQTGFGGNAAEAQKQLESVEASFAGTAAAAYAVMTRGDILFAQGKYKDAEAEYSKIASDKTLAPFAIYSLGKSKEADGDLPGAQAQYSDFLSKFPESFLAPEVHSSLARTQEMAGAKDLARGSYEKISLLYPDTPWAMEAKARLQPPAAPQKK
ncbi:MAG: tetratricopeptide repeat protein [Elusimicrobia bacterium]|nr:tetratricopeptide repeat protein [Elusimicrobiota bacterium]